jgi:predicted DNA-binding antitoxin AbrB/MazE fold protein
MVAVRAIYENGSLKLLDSVDLSNGDEVIVTFLSDQERLNIAAHGRIHFPEATPDDDVDEAALLQELATAFNDLPPLSEWIIQERQEGP